MNPANLKWSEFLKANEWQTGWLAGVSFVFWVLVRFCAIPTDDSSWWEIVPISMFLIFLALTMARISKNSWMPWWRTRRRVRLDQKRAEEYMPYMTDREKTIIGYLLYHNQKMFQGAWHGSVAATLLARGIIRKEVRDSALTQVPFSVPDHIWTVLERHRESFPYTPPENPAGPPPWREDYWWERN